MTDSFTLEAYRFGDKPANASEPPASKLWSRQVASDLIGAAEAIAVVAGGLLPSIIYGSAGAIVPNWPVVLQSALIAALIYRMYLSSVGMYNTHRSHDFAVRPWPMITALTFGIVAALGLGSPPAIGLQNLVVWFGLWLSASYMGAVLVRTLASDYIAAKTVEGRFDERIAVYGAGSIARRVHDYLVDPTLGLRFVGVYDTRGSHDRVNPEGLTVAGGLDDLIAACQEGRVDRVIIALPQVAERRVRDIARRFEDLSVHLHIVTHMSTDFVGSNWVHQVSQLGPVGLMDVKMKNHTGWAPILKRTEDIVIGSVAAAVVAPLIPLIALAIKLDSRGPVLFRQRRRGRNKRVFEVLKFRTMSVMEDGDKVDQARTADPRITRVGSFLRRTSLDELPQLWNVLKGDMSLVGPRPHALVHDEKWGQVVETYANRHQMKPGVTGLAQVNGFRGEMMGQADIEGRVEHDLAYIRTWSLWLDIKILFRTVWAVAKGTNAR
ncbi:MAG: undecaprenyl-phosphate glucose phosphotransferase [Hyphomicrobiaceae bacterium]|nr:undecaprenyl-phosphate glucose phosphotransferase [Hyphomicrobiaceae bacterium]